MRGALTAIVTAKAPQMSDAALRTLSLTSRS
jgi:hypothetical protein